jgi:uncharacterized membrane protein YhaH (DUF805 family)
MLTFFFNPLGRIAQYEFTLGWLFWLTLELGCFLGLLAATPNSLASFYWFLALTSASGLSTVSVVLLGIKRLRDAGLPVWPAVVLLIPGLSIVGWVVLSNMISRPETPDRQL